MSEKQQKNNNSKLKKFTVITGIMTAIFLCAIKAFASIYTGSLAVLSSLIDSLSDVFASLVSYIAIKISTKPANCNYRYGFGKAEAISAALQAAFIAGSGIFVLYDGIDRIFHPVEISGTGIGLAVMVVCIVVTFILIMFQRYMAKKTDSIALKAESAHYVVDLLTNGAIILSLVIVKYFNIWWFDTLAALAIAVYLLYNAYTLGYEALQILADKELSPEIREKIAKIITNTQGIMGFHDLRSRNSGGNYLFEFHVEIDGKLSLYEAHEITDTVEKTILEVYPSAQVIIHQDPFGIEENRLDNTLDGYCQKV